MRCRVEDVARGNDFATVRSDIKRSRPLRMLPSCYSRAGARLPPAGDDRSPDRPATAYALDDSELSVVLAAPRRPRAGGPCM